MPSVSQHKAGMAPPAHLHTVPAAVAATAAHHAAGEPRLAASRPPLLQPPSDAVGVSGSWLGVVAASSPIIRLRHSAQSTHKINGLLLICIQQEVRNDGG